MLEPKPFTSRVDEDGFELELDTSGGDFAGVISRGVGQLLTDPSFTGLAVRVDERIPYAGQLTQSAIATMLPEDEQIVMENAFSQTGWVGNG